MPVVTLTTDLGLKDHYAGVLKGMILSACPGVSLMDISNQVDPFNIAQAAFLLENSYQAFPAGSLHLVCVDTDYQQEPLMLWLHHQGHYFAGPDNGVFSLAFGGQEPAILRQLVREPGQTVFSLLAATAGRWNSGQGPEAFSRPLAGMKSSLSWQPQIEPDFIRGRIIYIDRFQNCIVNVKRETLEGARSGRGVHIYFKRFDDIREIQAGYGEEGLGEKMARYNEDGYLEIAMNKGNAAGLLGLQVNDIVQIDFL